MGDTRITKRYITSAVGISQDKVHFILRKYLDMRTLSGYQDFSENRSASSAQDRICRVVLRQIPISYCWVFFMIMDETLVHHFTSESKQQSKQRKHPGSPCQRSQTVPSARKVIASICLWWWWFLMEDYLQKGADNGTDYASLLRQLI